ncbi:MAG: S-layer domain-containing protein [candidate division CPR1 bacterium GW2011_GWA2_42_17]|uniref:S-layer domain-containing protein n=1 Tax=candidate division CPR1 bacterium GW2011_GWA2_42_17 TaxID=1618341 RepID=A0A0G1BY31_9BACT|nr:MAG: S-layer domain-containing protein [candidate division CPR1 bacterium GW2011_GWA2_42_17]
MSKLLQLIIALTILTSVSVLTAPVLAATNGDFDCPYRGGDDGAVTNWLNQGVCDGAVDCSGQEGCLEAKAWCTYDQCSGNQLGGRCGVCHTSPFRVIYLSNADGTPGECPEEYGFISDNVNTCYIDVSTEGGVTPPLPAGRYYVYQGAGCWEPQELTLTEGCVLSGSLPCKIIGGPGLTCGTGPGPVTTVCQPKEWKCKNKNVAQPATVCWSGIIASSRSCTPAGSSNSLCPTNQDQGQKDGTGQSRTLRTYNTFDYDSGKILSIPPVVLKATTPAPTPSVSPTPGPTPTPIPTDNLGVPCGWPTENSHRVITQTCPSNECPASAAQCLDFSHSYNALDIRGDSIPIYATLSGAAIRYVAATQGTASANYGVYIIIVNYTTGYQALYAHLQAEPGDQVGDVKNIGEVQAGDRIGTALVGSTGFTDGPHLHYEVRRDSNRLCPNTFLDCQRSTAASPSLLQQALGILGRLESLFSKKEGVSSMPEDSGVAP